MSLEQNLSEQAIPDVPYRFRNTRRLAKLAYHLACTSPLALWVMVFCYPQTDPKALPALPVQILWWTLCFCSPVGVILGAITFFQFCVGTLGARKMGVNYAIAALVVGSLATLSLLMGVPMLMSGRKANHHPSRSCLSNVKMLNTSLLIYAQDYDDHYLPVQAWNDAIWPYTKNTLLLSCPEESDEEKRPTYALNSRLRDTILNTVQAPEQTVTFFDSVPGNNLHGGMELLPNPSRHDKVQMIGFLDGHAKAIPTDRITGLLWTPQIKKKPEDSHLPGAINSTETVPTGK